MKSQVEKSLKRWLKRKVSLSTSLLVLFLITGNVSFSLTENEKVEVGTGATTSKYGVAVGINTKSTGIHNRSDAYILAIQKALNVGLAKSKEAGVDADTIKAVVQDELSKYSGQDKDKYFDKSITKDINGDLDNAVKMLRFRAAEAMGVGNIAIGHNATANKAPGTIAIGDGAIAGTKNGMKNDLYAQNAIAIGKDAEASIYNSISIGDNTKASNHSAIAIGGKAESSARSSVAIGRKAKGLARNSVAIGANATSTNLYSYGEKILAFNKKKYDRLSGGVAIGKGTFATVASVDIGSREYTGEIGDINFQGGAESNRVGTDGVGSITIGGNSVNYGNFATVNGSHSIISSNSFTNVTGPGFLKTLQQISNAKRFIQGFGSNITGSFNSIENKDLGMYSGMASSIVGVANKINNSNGSLIYGAGNKITNSYLDLKGGFDFAWSLKSNKPDSIKNLQDRLFKLTQERLGSVGIFGGANSADRTIFTNISGIGNTIKGKGNSTGGSVSTGTNNTPEYYSALNSIVGYENTLENVKHTNLSGAWNTVTNAEKSLVMGNNHILRGTDTKKAIGNAIIGFNKKVGEAGAGSIKDSATDIFVLGNDVKANLDNSVYLGSNSTEALTTNTIRSVGNGVYDTEINPVIVGGYTYPKADFAGLTSKGIVTIGYEANERRLQNVAAGLISATSTDAINGSQLYWAMENLQKGWNVQVNGGDTTSINNQQAGTTPSTNGGTGTTNTSTTENYVEKGETEVHIGQNNKVNLLEGDGIDLTYSYDKDKLTTNVKHDIITDDKTTQIIGEDKTGNKIVKVGDKFFEVDEDGKLTQKEVKPEDVKSTQVAAKTTDLTVSDGKVKDTDKNLIPEGKLITPANSNSLATAGDIANAINSSGFTINSETKDKDGKKTADVKKLINPGETIKFVDGQGTKVNAKVENGILSIQYDIPVDGESVIINDKGQLQAVLTKESMNLEEGKNISIKTNNKGLLEVSTKDNVNFTTIKVGNENNSPVISSNNAGDLSVEGAKIVNVKAGTAPTDAVNVSQLNGVVDDKISQLKGDVDSGLANSSAMAGIEFLEIGINQATVGASLGTYRGHRSIAVGVQAAPTMNTRVHAKVAASPRKGHENTMMNIGASWRFNWK